MRSCDTNSGILVTDSQGLMSTPEETAATRTAASRLRESPPDHPTRVGRFSLLHEVGAGGMGRVYTAYDPELQRRVALKLLHDGGDDGHRQRLVREAQALARLDHPNVVTVHDVGVHQGAVFVAMEFVRGGTLKQWLAANPLGAPHRFDNAMRLLLGAGRGLVAAHAADLIHRDVKPSNILVGEDGRARVADFGIARALEWPASRKAAPRSPDSEDALLLSTDDSGTPLTRTGASVGTPAYMAPEQLAGERVGAAADQFSYCVMAWEVLFGVRPFAGETTRERLAAIRKGELRRPADVEIDGEVEALLRRGLRARPGARHRDLERLVEALTRRAKTETMKPRRPVRRWALVLLGVGVVGSAAAYRHGATKQVCSGAATIDEVWNDQRRQRLRAVPPGPNVDATPNAREELVSGFDQYGEAWRAAHQEACEAARVRGELSLEQMENRLTCLEQAKLSLDAELSSLLSNDPPSSSATEEVLGRLPLLEECTAIRAATTPAQQFLLDTVARTEALRRAGQPKEALRMVERLARSLDGHPSPTLRARVLLEYGRALSEASRDGALEAFDEAYAVAHSGGLPRLASAAARELAMHYALSLADADRGRAWLHLASSSRARGPVQQEFDLLLTEGALLALEGDDEGATRVLERGLRLAQPSPEQEVRVLRQLATHLVRVDPERAVAVALQALEASRHRAKDRPYELAKTEEVAAASLSRVGELDRADALATHALELANNTWGPGHIATTRYLARVADVRCSLSGARAEGTQIAERAVMLHTEQDATLPRHRALDVLNRCVRWGPDRQRAAEVAREFADLTIALFGEVSFKTAHARAMLASTLLRNSDVDGARRQTSLAATQHDGKRPGWNLHDAHHLHRELAGVASQLDLHTLASHHSTAALELGSVTLPPALRFGESDTCAAKRAQGDLADALVDCLEALEASREHDQPVRSALLSHETASILSALQRDDEALIYMQEAVELLARTNGSRSYDAAVAELELASIHEDLRQDAAAESHYRSSFQRLGAFPGLEEIRITAGLGLARTAARQGRAAEALAFLDALERETPGSLPDPHISISVARGFVLHAMNPRKGSREYARAIRYYRFTGKDAAARAVCDQAPFELPDCEDLDDGHQEETLEPAALGDDP